MNEKRVIICDWLSPYIKGDGSFKEYDIHYYPDDYTYCVIVLFDGEVFVAARVAEMKDDLLIVNHKDSFEELSWEVAIRKNYSIDWGFIQDGFCKLQWCEYTGDGPARWKTRRLWFDKELYHKHKKELHEGNT